MFYGRYGNCRVRHSVCSIIMQRVVGMTHVDRDVQRAAHRYAQQLMQREEKMTGDLAEK
jgi:hypothetical protein